MKKEQIIVVLRHLCTIALAVDLGLMLGYAGIGQFADAWSHFGIALWWAFARTLWLSE